VLTALLLCVAVREVDPSHGDAQHLPLCGGHTPHQRLQAAHVRGGSLLGQEAAQPDAAGKRAAGALVLAALPLPGVLSDVSSEGFSEPAHLSSAARLAGVGVLGEAPSRAGTKMLWTKGAAANWLGFEDAKHVMRSLALTRRADFWEWWKRERPVDLPYNPDKAYRCKWRAGAHCSCMRLPSVSAGCPGLEVRASASEEDATQASE
jgi:hypothetical protein